MGKNKDKGKKDKRDKKKKKDKKKDKKVETPSITPPNAPTVAAYCLRPGYRGPVHRSEAGLSPPAPGRIAPRKQVSPFAGARVPWRA